jgi:hypothetical protein
MHREAILELSNIETDAQAGIEPFQGKIPSRYIARIGRGSVVAYD